MTEKQSEARERISKLLANYKEAVASQTRLIAQAAVDVDCAEQALFDELKRQTKRRGKFEEDPS